VSDTPSLAVSGLTIFMRGLTVEAEIGVYAHEKGRRQPLRVEVEAVVEPRIVGGISDTLNYEHLASAARRLANEGHIDLVETYAERLAAVVLDHAQVRQVRVRVEKPEALQGAIAGIEVTAHRPRP
jgi:dihydroneopterin aldolase